MHNELLKLILSFDWDKGNLKKNLIKHDVEAKEAEEIFINKPFILLEDAIHSKIEKRYGAYGRTHEDRKLYASSQYAAIKSG